MNFSVPQIIRSDKILTMNHAQLLRKARKKAGLTLVELAERAGTSASTLNRYELGKVDPSGAVVGRVLAAAGFQAEVTLRPLLTGPRGTSRSEEVVAALELAEQFPVRFERRLNAPIFGATK